MDQQFEGPAGPSFGGWATADGHQMGLEAAVELGRYRRRLTRLAFQSGLLALGDEGLADAGDSIDVHAQGGRDLGVDAVAAGAIVIAEQEDLGMADLLGRSIPIAGDLVEALALLGGEPYGVLVGCEQDASPSVGRN